MRKRGRDERRGGGFLVSNVHFNQEVDNKVTPNWESEGKMEEGEKEKEGQKGGEKGWKGEKKGQKGEVRGERRITCEQRPLQLSGQ